VCKNIADGSLYDRVYMYTELILINIAWSSLYLACAAVIYDPMLDMGVW